MDFQSDEDRLKPLALFSQSSLTDIVLLLLIFFLLTSSFVTNFGIRVEVPRAQTSVQTEQNFITVSVTPDGEFYVDGDLTSPALLAAAIREVRNTKPEAPLVLRADRNAIIDDAVRVMNIAQALNLRIVMATEQGTR